MPSFDKYWEKSNGKGIDYKGNKLFQVDAIEIAGKQKVLVKRISTNSEWRQGVALDVKGCFTIEGTRIKNKTVFWENTAPSEIIVEIESKDGQFWARNVWDHGNGVMQSWYNGAAMIIEEIPNGRRYYCNDGHPDENFDDIVFEIIILK